LNLRSMDVEHPARLAVNGCDGQHPTAHPLKARRQKDNQSLGSSRDAQGQQRRRDSDAVPLRLPTTARPEAFTRYGVPGRLLIVRCHAETAARTSLMRGACSSADRIVSQIVSTVSTLTDSPVGRTMIRFAIRSVSSRRRYALGWSEM